LLQFSVESIEDISKCLDWILSVSSVVESQSISDYSDRALGWMGSLGRLQAISDAKLLEVEVNMNTQSARLIVKKADVLPELKYRLIDMLCATDEEYLKLVNLKKKLKELNTIASSLWRVLELSVRTTHRLLDIRKRDDMAPPT